VLTTRFHNVRRFIGVESALRQLTTVVAVLVLSACCHGQYCNLDFEQGYITELGGTTTNGLGSAIDVFGNRAAISGAYSTYVFEYGNGEWAQQSELVAVDSPPSGISTPSAIGAFGDCVIVGNRWATGSILVSGSAYVFRYVGTEWVQAQELYPEDPIQLQWFGHSVAVDGATAAVGATGDDDLGPQSGSVYVYEDNGTAWQPTNKIMSPQGQPGDHFGRAVAIDGDTLVVGCPDSDIETDSSVGSAIVFKRVAGEWGAAQTLLAPTPIANQKFGMRVRLDGSVLVVGCGNEGAVYLFTRRSEDWVFSHSLTQTATSIDVIGNTVVTGQASTHKIETFRAVGATWTPSVVDMASDSTFGFGLGASVAIHHDSILAGTRSNSIISAPSRVYLFDRPTPADCNLNGLPDYACDADPQYSLDNGDVSVLWGGLNPGGELMDIIWLNQFEVSTGGSLITHVDVAWVAQSHEQSLPFGTTLRVMVYSDPNQDGDPSDAILMASAVSRVENLPFPFIEIVHRRVAVGSVRAGDPGESFFVAAMVASVGGVMNEGVYPVIGTSGPVLGRSWIRVGLVGQTNLQDLSQNPPHQVAGNFMLRAIAGDCNDNGVWDPCDIDSGQSADFNDNGIPDECEQSTRPSCIGDIAPRGSPNGIVNVDDLLAVINAWGSCANPKNCPADISPTGGNDVVNVDDLLALINAWGNCP